MQICRGDSAFLGYGAWHVMKDFGNLFSRVVSIDLPQELREGNITAMRVDKTKRTMEIEIELKRLIAKSILATVETHLTEKLGISRTLLLQDIPVSCLPPIIFRNWYRSSSGRERWSTDSLRMQRRITARVA